VGRDPLLSLNVNLDALARGDATDRARELFSRIFALYEEGYYATAPDIVSFNTVLNGFREDPAAAIAFWEENVQRLTPNTRSYNTILLALARSGLHKECLEILRLMEDDETAVWPDRITYNTVLGAFGTSSDPEAPHLADALLEEMVEASQQTDPTTGVNKGVCPDVISYNTVIQLFASRGDTAKAQAWFDRMSLESGGPRPDVYTYTILMEMWANSGGVDEALKLLEEMKAQPSAYSFPNVRTFSALVKALGNQGRMEEAHDVVKSMWKYPQEAQPDVFTYSILLNSWSRVAVERPHEAVNAVGQILQEMRQHADRGLEPNAVTYTNALKVLARAKCPVAVTRAHDLVTSMKEKANKYHYNALLSVYSKSDRKDRERFCVDTYKAMKKMGGSAEPDLVTYNILLQTLSNAYGSDEFKHHCLVDGLQAYKDLDQLAQKLLQESGGDEQGQTRQLPSSMTYSFLVRLIHRCSTMVKSNERQRLFQQLLKACGPKYGCLNATVWDQLVAICTEAARQQECSIGKYLGLTELLGKDSNLSTKEPISFEDLPADWSRRALSSERRRPMKSVPKDHD
jgi:pentatricopeptide repeat protein